MPPHPARAAYFLDFDGCLVAIAPRPDAVVIPRGLVQMLDRLYHRAGGALALVSGRAIADLQGFLPGLNVPMVGCHGAEHARGRGRVTRLRVDRDILAQAIAALHAAAGPVPGFLVEVKPVSVGLHYRANPALEPEAEAIMGRIAKAAPGFHLHQSKQMIELRPDGADKGQAVAKLLSEASFQGRCPVVMGDDLTDEPAFAQANRRGGVSVKIGQGATAARHRLRDPQQVRHWLNIWGAS
ncbi:trehalose-phosphatase [Rhodophyticola sp. CCM32]|uniref:trehalose-phosphatase n=1 Tax=Rhodophyticola sp. CCM32 TaxID=2916397 RepID=UPI00107F1E9E|nr:trehalose-phosphatase [Rhodophyticola sp. CCM32]QBY00357.1 trehalose-phosphatase [Rhodophyticola sp. CCM32]